MYDVTRVKTYEKLNEWLGEIKKNADQDVCVLLVGNKTDKLEGDPDLRCTPVKTVKEWTESHGIFSYREISAFKREDADAIMKVLLEGECCFPNVEVA